MSDSDFEGPISRRTVPVELRYYGSGALEPTDGGYEGGVVDPVIGDAVGFQVWREVPDEDGILNPIMGEDSVDAAFQVSLEGTAAGFRELARYLLAIAELDLNGQVNDFHEHHEVASLDGRTRFHIIVRRRE